MARFRFFVASHWIGLVAILALLVAAGWFELRAEQILDTCENFGAVP